MKFDEIMIDIIAYVEIVLSVLVVISSLGALFLVKKISKISYVGAISGILFGLIFFANSYYLLKRKKNEKKAFSYNYATMFIMFLIVKNIYNITLDVTKIPVFVTVLVSVLYSYVVYTRLQNSELLDSINRSIKR